jgi:hypothetical protein
MMSSRSAPFMLPAMTSVDQLVTLADSVSGSHSGGNGRAVNREVLPVAGEGEQ